MDTMPIPSFRAKITFYLQHSAGAALEFGPLPQLSLLLPDLTEQALWFKSGISYHNINIIRVLQIFMFSLFAIFAVFGVNYAYLCKCKLFWMQELSSLVFHSAHFYAFFLSAHPLWVPLIWTLYSLTLAGRKVQLVRQ